MGGEMSFSISITVSKDDQVNIEQNQMGQYFFGELYAYAKF
jgi:hypothetical protein